MLEIVVHEFVSIDTSLYHRKWESCFTILICLVTIILKPFPKNVTKYISLSLIYFSHNTSYFLIYAFVIYSLKIISKTFINIVEVFNNQNQFT